MDLLAQYSDSEGEVGSMGFQRAPMTDSHGKNGNIYPPFFAGFFMVNISEYTISMEHVGLGRLGEQVVLKVVELRLSNE